MILSKRSFYFLLGFFGVAGFSSCSSSDEPTYTYPPSFELGELDREIDTTFTIRQLEMEPDYEGPVKITLLSHFADSVTNRAVLYIHGYGDYFFKVHEADWFNSQGYDFYALDLRKYGRSWLSHQKPCYVKDLSEYYPDIDTALAIIQKEGHDFILLNAHSTGGLTSSLYCSEGTNRGLVNALLLNSPFFDFRASYWERVGIRLVGNYSSMDPDGNFPPTGESNYGKSIHADFFGEWDYSPDYKPQDGFPIYWAWLGAVRAGHMQVKKGLDLSVPTLVLHSDCTYAGEDYSEEIERCDGVLDPERIAERALLLGDNTQIEEIPGGMHDIFLSASAVRKLAFDKVGEWLSGL